MDQRDVIINNINQQAELLYLQGYMDSINTTREFISENPKVTGEEILSALDKFAADIENPTPTGITSEQQQNAYNDIMAVLSGLPDNV